MASAPKFVVLSLVAQLLLAVIRLAQALFSVSVIHGGLAPLLEATALAKLETELKHTFSWAGVVTAWLARLFSNLNPTRRVLAWNCKGAMLFVVCALVVTFTMLLIRAIQNDWLLKVQR